jgi:formate hydrogenlyase subunit 4
MPSLALIKFAIIIGFILPLLIFINVVVYIVKKEVIKTTLLRSLKVFLAAIVIIVIVGWLMNVFRSNLPKLGPLIIKQN